MSENGKYNVPILRLAIERLQKLRDLEFESNGKSQTVCVLNDCIWRLVENKQRAEEKTCSET